MCIASTRAAGVVSDWHHGSSVCKSHETLFASTTPILYFLFWIFKRWGGGAGRIDETSPEGRPLLGHVVPLCKLEKENCLGTHRWESRFSSHLASQPRSAASAQLQDGTGSHAAETGHLQLLATGRGCLLSAAGFSPTFWTPQLLRVNFFYRFLFWAVFFFFLFVVVVSFLCTAFYIRDFEEQERAGQLPWLLHLFFGSGLNVCFSNNDVIMPFKYSSNTLRQRFFKSSEIFLFYLLWNFALRF